MDLFKEEVMQFIVSLVTQNVCVGYAGKSPHELVVTCLKMKYSLSGFITDSQNMVYDLNQVFEEEKYEEDL